MGRPGNQRYIVYDRAQRQYLEVFRKPVKGLDVAVTRWTEDRGYAMGFTVYAAAVSAVAWLDNGARTIVIINDGGMDR